MHKKSLNAFYRRREAKGEPLVLCIVVATSGSTYSKPGDSMLIDGEGRYHGMLSGGCLEGDLAIRARAVIESGRPGIAVYDLANDDELWGLGVGCEGRIDVLMLRLDESSAYEPFRTMADLFEGRTPAQMTLALAPEGAAPVGACRIESAANETLFATPGFVEEKGGAGNLTLALSPIPALLVLGAGPDVVPLIEISGELGWHRVVVDHRPAYIDSPLLEPVEERHAIPSESLSEVLSLDDFDFAVVMSHHLASDRNYLRALAQSRIGRIALLGPRARHDRLLRELGEDARALAGRVEGPAGLDIGGRGAAAIALSIVAGLVRWYEKER